LPSTKEGLAELGIIENGDYVVGKNGAKYGFKAPIQTPNKWDNIVHFSNGCIFQLVALDSPNAGRGLNCYAIIGDEAALFDKTRLDLNVRVTNRAKKERFKKASLLGAEVYASSTPVTKKGQWFVDMEKVCKLPANRKDHAFIKASVLVNQHNLQPGYLKRMKDTFVTTMLYEAEMLNSRPKEILNGFYPQLKPEKHYYTNYDNDYLEGITNNYTDKSFNSKQDKDIDKGRPLILSIDWGVFLSGVISQQLPNRYRVLKSIWAKQPNDEEDLINDFVAYYTPLPNKIVHLYYGHDGNAKVKKGTNETYGDALVKLLQAKGWTVYDKSKGKPVAPHNDKYLLINMMLKASSSRYPSIEINEQNNPDLIIGLERAEATEDKNGVRKVKKDERNASMKQEHTIHLPDAFDIPVWSIYKELLKPEREHWDLPISM